jgi:hypothetical protein
MGIRGQQRPIRPLCASAFLSSWDGRVRSSGSLVFSELPTRKHHPWYKAAPNHTLRERHEPIRCDGQGTVLANTRFL